MNGICPISEAEWKQAVLDKAAAAASSSAEEEKHGSVDVTAGDQARRMWQQRAIILYTHTTYTVNGHGDLSSPC